jgi:HEAT repeat protein
MRHDPEKMVRMDVMRALRRQKTKEAEAAVCEGLKDSTPLVRMSAAEALGHMEAVDAIPLLRTTLDSDPDPEVRLSAVESLVILGDESARDRVPEALSAISRRVRLHPRYKKLREAAESGEALTPWVSAWEK